jgi:hypothetical protein
LSLKVFFLRPTGSIFQCTLCLSSDAIQLSLEHKFTKQFH